MRCWQILLQLVYRLEPAVLCSYVHACERSTCVNIVVIMVVKRLEKGVEIGLLNFACFRRARLLLDRVNKNHEVNS